MIFKSAGGFGAPAAAVVRGRTARAQPRSTTSSTSSSQHRDTDGKNTVARRTARRLLEYFAHAEPVARASSTPSSPRRASTPPSTSQALAARDLSCTTTSTRRRRRRRSAPTTKKSVKWPIDYVVSTLRLLGMKLEGRATQYVDGGNYGAVRDILADMGQMLLDPPSVFGWDWETAWISSATLLARYAFARDLVVGARWTARPASGRRSSSTSALTDPDGDRRRGDRPCSASPTS